MFEESSIFNKNSSFFTNLQKVLSLDKGKESNKRMDRNSLAVYLQINILNTFLIGKNTLCPPKVNRQVDKTTSIDLLLML